MIITENKFIWNQFKTLLSNIFVVSFSFSIAIFDSLAYLTNLLLSITRITSGVEFNKLVIKHYDIPDKIVLYKFSFHLDRNDYLINLSNFQMTSCLNEWWLITHFILIYMTNMSFTLLNYYRSYYHRYTAKFWQKVTVWRFSFNSRKT